MSLTPTDLPNTFHVTFMIGETAARSVSSVKTETEIVCTLTKIPGGPGIEPTMHIVYEYHLIRSRPTTVGPFDEEVKRILPLTPSLAASIEHAVKEEFWNSFRRMVVRPGVQNEG